MKFFAMSCEVFGVLELNSLVAGRAGAADTPAWDRLRGIEGTGSTANNTKTPRVLMIDAWIGALSFAFRTKQKQHLDSVHRNLPCFKTHHGKDMRRSGSFCGNHTRAM
jgi:hypothetical protein